MHFAANALVGESMENPSKYFRNNVGNGVNLLDAMVETGVQHFVFSSTCATFGPPERVPIDETLPQRPINPYGESKLIFEKILRWYDEIHGLKFRLAALLQRRRRLGKIWRRSPARNASHPECPEGRARTESRTSRFTAPTTRRRMAPAFATTFTFSICRARIFLRSTRRKSDFYNLGTGGGSSVREVIDACRKITGQENSGCGKTAPTRRSAAA